MMGGVYIDINGVIMFFGLYVVGEIVCVSINGVNCLGLNLLFELLVFGV